MLNVEEGSLYSIALEAVARLQVPLSGLPSSIANDCVRCQLQLGLKPSLQDSISSLQIDDASFVQKVFNDLPLYCPMLTALTLPRASLKAGMAKQLIKGLPHLESLDVSNNPSLLDSDFENVSSLLPSLTSLALNGCIRLGNATFSEAIRCPQLQSLAAGQMKLNSQGVIAACKQKQSLAPLVHLTLDKAQRLDDAAIDAIVEAFGGTLLSLCLLYCFPLSDQSLASINRHCKVLHMLDISGCCNLQMQTPLHQLEQLRVFRAEFCDGMTTLDALPPHLEVLELGFCKNITQESVAYVCSQFSHLSRLRFQNQHLTITDADVSTLCRTCGPSLTELQMYPCLLGDVGMSALAECPLVEVLHLAGVWNEASDATFALIADRCTRLRSLSLGKLGEKASDATFRACAKLPGLEMLDLNLHVLSGQALAETAPLYGPHLRALSLRWCRQLNQDSIVSLAKVARKLQTLDLSHTNLPFDAVAAAAAIPSLTFLNVVSLNISPREEKILKSLNARLKLNL